MRRSWAALLLTFASSVSLPGQSPVQPLAPLPSQTAREALIEMFLGKNAEDFAKHLPDEARRTLIHKGETPETSVVLRISTIGRQMVAQSENLETFAEGPTILVSEEKDGHERIEVVVEHDSYLGEEDEIELSFHVYKTESHNHFPWCHALLSR